VRLLNNSRGGGEVLAAIEGSLGQRTYSKVRSEVRVFRQSHLNRYFSVVRKGSVGCLACSTL
jgi:hypothetical protein